jgi:hypothetical protein
MCFQQHSRFVPDFSTAVLCFQQHSRFVPSIFEVTTPAHGQCPQTECRFPGPCRCPPSGCHVLGGGSNPHFAGWEFFPQARQHPRFAGHGPVKRAFVAQDHAPYLPNRGKPSVPFRNGSGSHIDRLQQRRDVVKRQDVQMCSPGRIADGPPLTLTQVRAPALPVCRPLAGLLEPLGRPGRGKPHKR